MLFEELHLIRDAVSTDLPFIYSTWLKGLRFGCEWFGDIESRSYFTNYHKVIEVILARSNLSIKIAALREDPNTILGYCVYSTQENKKILHWAFTKKAWRKTGIAKHLVPSDITQCSHLTKVGRAIKPKEWIFDPFEL